MSGINWLQKQRKSDLVDIAQRAGFRDYHGLKKDELADALDAHLKRHKPGSNLRDYPPLQSFYVSKSESVFQPSRLQHVIQDALPESVENAIKSVQRRGRPSMKPKQESGSDSLDEDVVPEGALHDIQSVIARAPAQLRRSMPDAVSPAVVADTIEAEFSIVQTYLRCGWKRLGVERLMHDLRHNLSSVVAIEIIALIVEAYGLRRDTYPWRYAFDFPAIKSLGTKSHAIFVPYDFMRLLGHSFWAPTVLWATTSVLVPLMFAYIFNLTLKVTDSRHRHVRHAHEIDHFTFNVVKGLLAWIVYVQGWTLGGLFKEATVERVARGTYGGSAGILIGAAIGLLTTFWVEIQKKH